MSLTPGTKLGPYEIVAPLGAGGMGEVYRARDAKLGRDVAIKVLPEGFTADRERLARFEREAQLLAQLQHPGIAAIFGLEESSGVRALVMELVEGEDLTAPIARGPMPLADVLPIARQIADALEAAHEQGIIHRDLKPANVKVRPDGAVKVLDFGLAKAMDPAGVSGSDPTTSPTLTARATMLGTIIGTAAYMSPEQARGKAVDRRADIWAFGVVLYEMLTGRRAFEGDDVSTTLASVLKDELDWQALPADLPPSLRRLLRRCLEKDPKRRLSAIGDARLELEETEPAFAAQAARPAAAGRSVPLFVVAGVALLAVLATVGVTRLVPSTRAPSAAGHVARLSIPLPDGHEIAAMHRMPLAISPDGTRLAYVARESGKTQLFLRKLSEPEPIALAGTDNAITPFFSPDGRWIAFFAQGELKKIAVGGADLQTVCGAALDSRGGCWGADGYLYFAPTNTSGIWRVPASGGTATEVTRVDHAKGEVSHRWPHRLPDDRTLLYTAWTGPGTDECQIMAQSIDSGERHVLVSGGATPRYLAAGYLAYGRLDDLFAVPWRPSQSDIGGAVSLKFSEHPRLEGEGAAVYDVSENGTLVYVAGGAARYAHRVVWVDRDGKSEPLPLPEKDYESVAISPDGRQAVVQVMDKTVGIWLYDFARQTLTPLATRGGSSQAPVWTPDGRRVIYRATRNGLRNLYWRAADGTGDEEPLTTKENALQSPNSVSPDGEWVLFTESAAQTKTGSDIWMQRLGGNSEPRPLVQTEAAEIDAQVSPDGRWFAYQSAVSGVSEIYIQPFPDGGPSRQVSNGGGAEPRWSRDGRELFYVSGDELVLVEIASNPALVIGQPRVLIEGRYRPQSNANTAYDVSADGQRFLRIDQVVPDRPTDRIEIVLHWATELDRLASAK